MRVPTARVHSLAPSKALKSGRTMTPSSAPQPPSGGPRTAEEVWQEQLELGGAINADLQCAMQRHWQE